jgi:hypothetical protein
MPEKRNGGRSKDRPPLAPSIDAFPTAKTEVFLAKVIAALQRRACLLHPKMMVRDACLVRQDRQAILPKSAQTSGSSRSMILPCCLAPYSAASGNIRHLGLLPISRHTRSGLRHSTVRTRKPMSVPTFSVYRFHRKRCTWQIDPATNLLILNPFPRSPSLG